MDIYEWMTEESIEEEQKWGRRQARSALLGDCEFPRGHVSLIPDQSETADSGSFYFSDESIPLFLGGFEVHF